MSDAATATTTPPRRERRAPRDWPDWRDGDPGSHAAWRATVQERLDQHGEVLEDIRDAVTRPGIVEHVCRGAERVAGFAAEVVRNPSKGTIALAVIGAVLALAVMGWQAADLSELVRGLMPAALGGAPSVTP